jgi:hypothetical protein
MNAYNRYTYIYLESTTRVRARNKLITSGILDSLDRDNRGQVWPNKVQLYSTVGPFTRRIENMFSYHFCRSVVPAQSPEHRRAAGSRGLFREV